MNLGLIFVLFLLSCILVQLYNCYTTFVTFVDPHLSGLILYFCYFRYITQLSYEKGTNTLMLSSCLRYADSALQRTNTHVYSIQRWKVKKYTATLLRRVGNKEADDGHLRPATGRRLSPGDYLHTEWHHQSTQRTWNTWIIITVLKETIFTMASK